MSGTNQSGVIHKMQTERKKSHARAPGMTQVTIALDEQLLEMLTRIAQKNDRPRNRQIVKMLREETARYLAKSEDQK